MKATLEDARQWLARQTEGHSDGHEPMCAIALAQDFTGIVAGVECDCVMGIVAALVAEVERLRGQYNELLLSVSNKHEGETRHETALRYIREAEASFSGPYEASGPKAAEEKEPWEADDDWEHGYAP